MVTSLRALGIWRIMAVMTRYAFVALVALCVFSPAHAGWPPDETKGTVDYSDPANWPNDPDFNGLWKYWSFVPTKIQAQVDDRTRRLGTGAHVDRAFAKTTGDPRTIIAVIDSGMEWSEAELVNRMYLNPGELPTPNCPDNLVLPKHDRNGDGRFNVQDYTTTTGHDLPAFTTVCDPRITVDFNANGILDAQDLIHAFSDGTDADGNGYIDDISGWDFFHNDNDPADATGFGHGTGSSKDSAAEGNNGRGGLGTCPDCTLMMLRDGDAFVPEINNWSTAVIYAVDQGASVVNTSAGGGLTAPAFARTAIDYAYDNGVSVVISNSDLNSFQHNSPNTNNHTIAVHAITHNKDDWADSTTFFNFNACTNYGAHLTASIAADSCSSEAAGRAGGYLGLIYSAALKADIPAPRAFFGDAATPNEQVRRLTAEEVRQLFIGSVDTFFDPGDATNPLQFPTKNGFARRFGYGRPNLRRAIDNVLAQNLPPEVDLTSPLWFDVLYPDRTPMVPIIGRVGIRGAIANPPGTTFNYIVEWAPGVDPDDSAFTQIGKADMQSTEVRGPLAMWDISQITVKNAVPAVGTPEFQPDDPVNVYTVTVRVRATVESSNPSLNGQKGEYRRAVQIIREPDLLPAFPIYVGSSGESSPRVVDLNGDKKGEIVLADSSGKVHAYQADGSELAGFPVQVEKLPLLDDNGPRGPGHASAKAYSVHGISADRRSPIAATPAIGDIDGDGRPEIVVATWMGSVWAFHSDGTVVSGFPVALDRDSKMYALDEDHELEDGFFGSPVLTDLDGDKKLEIVVPGMDGKIYGWNGAGGKVDGFPVLLTDPSLPDDPKASPRRQRERIMGTPAVGDLNKDGIPDFVVGTNENYSGNGRLYAVDGRGNKAPGGAYLPGWPIAVVSTRFLPVVAQGLPISPVMVDLDGDKIPEIVVSGLASVPRAYDFRGKTFGASMANSSTKYGEKSDAHNAVEFTFVSYPAIADLDDDGKPDLVEGAAGTDAALAFATGGERHDFEHHMAAWDLKSAQYKRGFPRVIEDWQFFSTAAVADIDGDNKVEVIASSGGYFVHAWNVDGTEPKGWPKLQGGWAIATPAVGDVDGDGKLEVVVHNRAGYLFAWKTTGLATGRVDWGSYHHDNANTGNFDNGPDLGRRASPGGCSMSGQETGGGWLLWGALALVAVGVRRRVRA